MNKETRTAHINVRVSPNEHDAIKQKAEAFSMTPSALMRKAALMAGDRPARVADAETLARIRVDLKRIGNNLNQATRALNAYGPDEGALASVKRASLEVARAVSGISDLLATSGEA